MKIGWDIFFHHIWSKFGWVYDVINWLICIFKKLKYLWNEKRYLKIVNSIFLVKQATCLCFKMGSIAKMWFSSQYHFKFMSFSMRLNFDWSTWPARRKFDRSTPQSVRTLSVDRPLFRALKSWDVTPENCTRFVFTCTRHNYCISLSADWPRFAPFLGEISSAVAQSACFEEHS